MKEKIKITSIKRFPIEEYDIYSPEGSRAINEGIARKLGWKINENYLTAKELGVKDYEEKWLVPYRVPNYCHSIEAAWEIAERIPMFKLEWIGKFEGDKWRVTTRHNLSGEFEDYVTNAETAPMAICLAFLKI